MLCFGAAKCVAVCFRSEKQLLAIIKGTRTKNAAFDGLPGARWRYEALYADPLDEQYVQIVQDISGNSIEHVSLLASGGWAWSGWHIDSNPVGSVVSQLERGTNLWFFTHRTCEMKTLCRKRSCLRWKGFVPCLVRSGMTCCSSGNT